MGSVAVFASAGWQARILVVVAKRRIDRHGDEAMASLGLHEGKVTL
jgi:hypothetical protein